MGILQIHAQIEQIAPIHGLSSSGRIDFKDEATEEQKSRAAALMEELLPQLTSDAQG